jgi:hypothetical protein
MQMMFSMFFRWLEGEPTVLPFSAIQDALAGMEDEMPAALCRQHGFPVGCSVGHAALSSISLVGPDGREYRLATVIHFEDERQSLEWWRNNRDNPRRVVLKPGGEGHHVLLIAPIRPAPDEVDLGDSRRTGGSPR